MMYNERLEIQQWTSRDWNKPFSIEGLWWLPNSDRKVCGTLKYEPNKVITLTCWGCLDERHLLRNGNQIDEERVIFGKSAENVFVTLRNSVINYQWSSPPRQFDTVHYRGTELFLGGHIDDLDAMIIASIEYDLGGLEEWISKEAYKHGSGSGGLKPDGSCEGGVIKTYHYSSPNNNIRKLNAHLTIGTGFSFHGGSIGTYTIHQRSTLRLSANDSRNFRWHLYQMRSMFDLLTLLIGKKTYIRSCTVNIYHRSDAVRFLPDGEVLYFCLSSSRKPDDEGTRYHLPLIKYTDIEGVFESVLNNWYDKQTDLELVTSLFNIVFYDQTEYRESNFITLMQALECYCTHFHRDDSMYMSDADYEPIKQSLLNALPEGLDNCFKQSLRKGKLKYAHHKSLRNRLKTVMMTLAPQTQALFSNKPKEYSGLLADVRNQITHPSNTETSSVTESDKVYFHILRTKALLLILLLKQAGLPEELILQKLLSSWDWGHIFDRPYQFQEQT